MLRSCLRWSLVVVWPIVVLGMLSFGADASGDDAANQWANLVGDFVYDGPPPPVDESLVVGATGALANVIIYVRSANVKVHPDLANPSGEVVLENKNSRFEPHVLPIQLGQTLLIKNANPFGLNAIINPVGERGINALIADGFRHSYNFSRKHNLPVPVNSNVHPWMRAYVLPRDNPYAAVTAADGNFTIEKLPANEKLEFQVWHERAPKLEPEGKNWTKGRFEMVLMPGGNDIGVIKISPMAFEKK